jgi:HK97 family phage prohead protease
VAATQTSLNKENMEHKELALQSAKFEIKADGEGFTGYASTFGNIDSYGDTIVKGAYLKTLQVNGLPKMFFNHQMRDVPIGKWVKAEEDAYGLLLTGEFTKGNFLADQVKAALQHGTVDSMSIGYSLTKGGYDDTESGRTIKEVSRLAEVSIVTFPADKFARVDLSSVKFADEMKQISTIREFEMFLRDAGSFSKGAAQALTARAKELFTLRDAGGDDEAKATAAILARIKKISQ